MRLPNSGTGGSYQPHDMLASRKGKSGARPRLPVATRLRPEGFIDGPDVHKHCLDTPKSSKVVPSWAVYYNP